MMKKVYIKPKLDTYGSVEQLTLNGRNHFLTSASVNNLRINTNNFLS